MEAQFCITSELFERLNPSHIGYAESVHEFDRRLNRHHYPNAAMGIILAQAHCVV
jgi:hypothetical protein